MKRKPTHPGICFYEDVVLHLDVPLKEIKRRTGLKSDILLKFLSGNYPCSKTLAKNIGRMTNTSSESWYEMQVNYDKWIYENSFIDPIIS